MSIQRLGASGRELDPRVSQMLFDVGRGARTVIDLPAAGTSPGVPTSTFGPRLQALVAVLSGAYRLSKRAIDELVGDTFGVPIALGSVPVEG